MATIKALREASGLSIIDMCQALKTGPSTIYAWENGTRQPTVKSLYRLAILFGVPLEQIDVESDDLENYRFWRKVLDKQQREALRDELTRELRAAPAVHD